MYILEGLCIHYHATNRSSITNMVYFIVAKGMKEEVQNILRNKSDACTNSSLQRCMSESSVEGWECQSNASYKIVNVSQKNTIYIL